MKIEPFIPLTPRWYPLRYHPEHARLRRSRARFKVVVAGRRSGKTENCKREGVEAAIEGIPSGNGRYIFAAPVNDQAVKLYWQDVQALMPKCLITGKSESQHMIRLFNGSEISVVGIDRPERIEGAPIDWIAVDEFANTKKGAWERNIRPALSTPGRPGRAWILGVPEGRNHYWDIHQFALKQKAIHGDDSAWDSFHWKSADVIDADDLEEARNSMDPLSFAQEYEASFVNFSGRAYYTFERTVHAQRTLPYRPNKPLTFAFDFNREPGVAAVGQEHLLDADRPDNWAENICAWIGEVWVPHNSNTLVVARKLISDWGPGGRRTGGEGSPGHVGDVYLDGDSTGGSGGSAKVLGSDWDLILEEFRKVRTWNVIPMYPDANPEERVRVNAVNSAWMSASGLVRMAADPEHCPQIINDFEGTTVIEGGSGELDKDAKRHPERTHMSDACGYHVVREHPIVKTESYTFQL